MEGILAIRLRNLTADKPVGVLLAIKIIQRPLKIEGSAGIQPKVRDEARIPHEQVAVEGGIAIVR